MDDVLDENTFALKKGKSYGQSDIVGYARKRVLVGACQKQI
jgi:hypothetical protein